MIEVSKAGCWWSESMNRLLVKDDNGLVWVVNGGLESLRHYLGTGADSNPPMPADAVHLFAAATQTAEQAQPAEMVRDFHEAFGLPVNSGPSMELLHLRSTLIHEEHQEVQEAFLTPGNMPEIAKELADLVYVVYGTAISFGIDLDEALRRVHASNMSKRNPDGTVSRRDDGKILKPGTYRAPDLTGVAAGSPVTETTKQQVSEHELAGFLSTIGIDKAEGLKIGKFLLRGYSVTDREPSGVTSETERRP